MPFYLHAAPLFLVTWYQILLENQCKRGNSDMIKKCSILIFMPNATNLYYIVYIVHKLPKHSSVLYYFAILYFSFFQFLCLIDALSYFEFYMGTRSTCSWDGEARCEMFCSVSKKVKHGVKCFAASPKIKCGAKHFAQNDGRFASVGDTQALLPENWDTRVLLPQET